MKKILSIIAILMMAATSWASITSVQPTVGEGTSASPYEIASAGNLVWFANQVNNGSTSICGKLTSDIDLEDDQTMIGTKSNMYSGTFDGNCHTVKVNYSSSKSYAGLFLYISNAKITQLATTGTISSYNLSGGIVVYSANSEISRCVSNVSFYSTNYTCLTCGGIIGYVSEPSTVSDCLFYGTFDGAFLDDSFSNYSSIIDMSESTATISNCLYVNQGESGKCGTFCYSTKYVTVTISNCYYSKSLGVDQGTEISADAIADGEACYKLNNGVSDGTQSWYQVIGTDPIPLPFNKAGGTVYGGDDACPSPLIYSNQTHASGEATATVDGIYTIPCSNSGCDGQERYIAPELDSTTGFYNIANLGNLIWFAHKVNPITGIGELEGGTTINGKLTADIDLGDYQTMIGTSNHPYAGEFDGGNHEITVKYSTSDSYAALFRYIKGANIHNLNTEGSITTSAQYAAGIAGYCENSTIGCCRSSVSIYSSVEGEGIHGGIVANVATASTLNSCMYNGLFSGENTTNCGGLIGCSAAVTVSNSIYVNKGMFSTDGACTISRGDNVTISNCYYTEVFGTVQGTKLTEASLSTGEACYKLNDGSSDGSQTWYQTIGKDDLPSSDSIHATVYSGEDVCPSTLTYGNTTHSVGEYDSDGIGMCNNEDCNAEVYQSATYDNAASTYSISNKGNLIWFASKVKNGYTNINGKLTANIDLGTYQTMIGNSTCPYAGVFDGASDTISVNYTATGNYTALFQYTKGATISNLNTTGSIVTSYNSVAGIVAYSDSTQLNCCSSNIKITANQPACAIGGMVANACKGGGISNCIYSGTVIGENNGGSFGGMVSSVTDDITISNCVLISRASNTFNSDTSQPIAASGNATIENCYFSYVSDDCLKFGTTQGTDATYSQILSGEICYALNNKVSDGTQLWHQTIGEEPSPSSPLPAVYGGTEACPYPSSAYSNKTHNYKVSVADESTGELAYTCTNDGCTYSYCDTSKPEHDAETDTYILRNDAQLAWFVTNVNSGACNKSNALLKADLTLPSKTVIANSETYAYGGQFNGDNHSITINVDNTWTSGYSSLDGFAVFGYTNGATISHLITKGEIYNNNKADRYHDSGIVSNAKSTTIESCVSYVYLHREIISEIKLFGPVFIYVWNSGGIVGYADSNCKINNCAFYGKIQTVQGTDKWGLIAGYADDATISNCLACPSSVNLLRGINTYGCCTFSPGTPNLSNCYYETSFGIKQGTKKTSSEFSSGNVCNLLNGSVSDGTQSWYQTIGSDTYPLPDSSHGTVYAGTKACPTTKTYSNQTHTTTGERTDGDGYHYTACTTSGCSGLYEYEQPEYDTASETYQIANGGNLCWLSEQFALTCIDEANSMLLNDIDMTGCNYTPMGIDYDKPYKGLFDGKGYRIKNMSLSTNQGGYGFFGHVAGDSTVIKNLIIDSSCSVTSTSGGGVAGLIGCVQSTSGTTCNVYVQNCGNEANITGVENVAGILGGVYNNNAAVVNIYNCYNTGTISGSSGKCSAAIVGYARLHTNIYNTWNSGSVGGTENYYTFAGTWETTAGRGNFDGTIDNCYTVSYKNATENSKSGVVSLSEDQMRLGYLCSVLNAKCSSNADWTTWAQDIASETIPSFGTAGLHYTRTLTNQWGTICLPFASATGDHYDFYELTGVTDGALTLTKVTTPVAGAPYIIRRSSSVTDVDIPATSSFTVVTSPVTGSSANGLTLTGALTSTDITDQDGYIIANNSFWNIADIKGENKVYCDAYRAYLAGTAASVIIGLGNDTPTAVETINAITTGTAEYYDLNGHKLSGPQQGVNIVKFKNGTTTKVIIK